MHEHDDVHIGDVHIDDVHIDEVHIGEKKLKQVTSKKVLGVTIDDQLSWEEQVDNISKNRHAMRTCICEKKVRYAYR